VPLPRILFILSLLWGLAAFVATVGIRAPIQPTAGAYAPAVRGLLALLATGLVVLWPLSRLLLATGRWDARRAALDALVLVVLLQGAFWPLHLVTAWPLARSAAIDALLSGWAAAAGAAIALGLRGPHPLRWAYGCLALAAAGPLLDALAFPAPAAELAGPFAALSRMASPDARRGLDSDWALAAWPWILAAGGWFLAVRQQPPHGCRAVADPLP
jgi:hypothetical protein